MGTYEEKPKANVSRRGFLKGAVIKAPRGKTLTMTVDGVKTELAPGTYTGKIVLTLS